MARFGLSDLACLSDEFKQRVADATLNAGAWDYGLAGSARLRLAGQLGGRDPKIVEDVAEVAFYPDPVAGVASSDIRPEARSVLASFGQIAAPWREPAMKLMHARDSLGTSAAQVAAASRDPEAVRAVADMLHRELQDVGRKPIARKRAGQLVELAYALGAAGHVARPYIGTLVELLARDIESAAPPFGIIERPPNEVCRAIQQIGGEEAEKALTGERCEEPWSLSPS